MSSQGHLEVGHSHGLLGHDPIASYGFFLNCPFPSQLVSIQRVLFHVYPQERKGGLTVCPQGIDQEPVINSRMDGKYWRNMLVLLIDISVTGVV